MNNVLKKVTAVVLAVVLCFGMFVGCAGTKKEDTTEELSTEQILDMYFGTLKTYSEEELLTGLHHVEMDIEGKGTIKIELNADEAPISVTNFMELAESGFYTGITFHRILTGSLIQGGSPSGDGLSSGEFRIKGEFASNGVENNLSHTRGAISMARASVADSGSTQFFIMTEDQPMYDGEYAAFGYVTEGMDIVDDLCLNTPVTDGNGTVAAENQPVITEVRVID
ncbi:MAG: peptidylprolyl isomerase [Firmicutes bacterium]|nr:peptidylprolyl isomerase [Bacillota bacterium]